MRPTRGGSIGRLGVLDYAQKWTAAVDWRSVEVTRRNFDECNAFLDPNVAEEEGKRLRMPGRAEA